VNDRGPYHGNRLIDVSVRTAKLLGFYDRGTARVRVDYVGPASLAGSDDSRLEATLRRGTPAPGPAEVRVASSLPSPRQFHDKRELSSEVTAVARRAPEPPAGKRQHAASRARAQVASRESPSSFEARFAPAAAIPAAAARVEPVPAFAPTTSRLSSGAILTGRGLY